MAAFLLCTLTTLSGCQRISPDAPSDDVRCLGPSNDVRTHDFGDVISGEELCHAFSYTNDSDECLLLDQKVGIRKDCGCQDVQVRASDLAPGDTTEVVVKLNTTEKVGRFEYGGVVTWRTKSGGQVAPRFTLRGLSRRAVTSAPSVLHFDPEDVRLKRIKEIRFSANYPVNWKSAKVEGTQPLVHLVSREISGNQLICKIQCEMSEEIEHANGVLALSVPLVEPRETLPVIRTAIPVSVRQELDFVVSPKLVTVKQDRRSGKGSARFQVRGAKVSSNCFNAVTCEGYTVDWSISEPTHSGMAVVTVSLRGKMPQTASSKANLVLDVDAFGLVHVPLVWLTEVPQ